MAKKVLQINNFSGGLNSYSDPRDLKENEFQALDNASVDEEGIIRVSGALERKENLIDAFEAEEYSNTLNEYRAKGANLFSFSNDYYPAEGFGNYNLTPTEADSSLAIGVESNPGVGSWVFGSSSSDSSSDFSSYDISTAAINEIDYVESQSYNLGSLSLKNLTLKAGQAYQISVSCVSETPWFYLGSNIPPRLRLYNETLGKYKTTNAFSDESDATHTPLLSSNFGNLLNQTTSTDTGAGGNITYSDGSWTATGSAVVTRTDISDTIPSTIEMITASDDRDFADNTDIANWVEYDGGETLSGALSISSNTLLVNPTTATSIEGAQLPVGSMGTLVAGETYTVSAKIVSTSGTIPGFKIGLGEATTESFSITTSTTAITRDIIPITTSGTDAALRIYYQSDTDVNWYIDDVSVTLKRRHRNFNSLFGSLRTSGDNVNAHAMKIVPAVNNGDANADGNRVKSHEITVSPLTKYVLDGFYNTNGDAGTVGVGLQIYDVSGGNNIIDITNSSSLNWIHINEDSSSNEDKVPSPIIFQTPEHCVKIQIYVGVKAGGTASNNYAYFTGFNLRKQNIELGTAINHIGDALLGAYSTYPNSWSNENDGTSYDSLYLQSYNNYRAKKVRKYAMAFYIPQDFEDSDDWTLSFESGIWGGLSQNGKSSLLVEKLEIYELLGDDFQASDTPLLTSYNKTGKGNNVIAQFINGNIGLYQYNPKNNSYFKNTDIFFPSNSNSDYNFINSGRYIYYCDKNFIDKALHSIKTEKNGSLNYLNVSFEGPAINYFSQDANLSGIDQSHVFDALSHYKARNSNNDDAIPILLDNLWDWVMTWKNNSSYDYFEGMPLADYGINENMYRKFNQYNGNVLELSDTSEYGLVEHDRNANWVGGAGREYIKYITIKNDDIVGTSVDKLLNGSRIAKVNIDLAHLVYGAGEITNYSTGLKIPKMTIYLDAITDTAADLDGYAIEGNSGFIKNLGSITVNPSNLTYNNENSGYLGSLVGHQASAYYSYNYNYGSGSNLHRNRMYVAFGKSGGMFQDTTNEFAAMYSNSIDTENNILNSLEIYIDFNETSDGTNAVTVGTSGTNLQLRFVPHIDEFYNTQNTYKYHQRPQSLAESSRIVLNTYVSREPFESDEEYDHYYNTWSGLWIDFWRIKNITLQSYISSQSESMGDSFSHILGDSILANISFETPLEGDADGWDDEWSLNLTSVNTEGIESAIGQSVVKVTNDNMTKCPKIGIILNSSNSTLRNNNFIKGYMSSKRNANYNLQFIINCKKNTIKSSTTSREWPAFISQNTVQFVLDSKELLIPNEIDSYESETSVVLDDPKDYRKLTATFKTAVVAKNTLYAGNVMQDGVKYPDRMLKSPLGKAPLLPSSNFIDVALNDGDEITCLKFYKDKLLQFKRNKLFVVNTSEDYEYLEDTIENVGIASENQATTTPYGIVWINPRGCYLYDGSKINYLTDKKIAYKEWKDSESSWEINERYAPIITYLKKSDKILVFGSTLSINELFDNEGFIDGGDYYSPNKEYILNMGYQYDFKSKTWTCITAFENSDQTFNEPTYTNPGGRIRLPKGNLYSSNFAYDENGDSIFFNSNNEIFKWDDNPKRTWGHLDLAGFNDNTSPNNVHRDFRIITKDYDFGAPSVGKKIYKVYVTFKSTESESLKKRKVMQTQDIYRTSNVGVYYAKNGSNNWEEFSESKSKNYGTKGLINTDSETTTTLSSSVSASSTTINVASALNIKVGYVLKIYNSGASTSQMLNEPYAKELMLVKSISGTTITVDRAYSDHQDVLSHSSGDIVSISTGDWIIAELKPSSSINNIDSFKIKFETKKIAGLSEANSGVPSGFMINDISVIYKTKNVK